MKFLQTSDWHLGKVFHEQSLLEDQRFFLSQITNELSCAAKSGSPYDALLIPGDIYDRAVPPAEAVTMLSGFLDQTHTAFPDMHVFMLSGNHDSADRLSFAAAILRNDNIHICTDFSKLTEPVICGTGNGKTAVYQIPYLTPGCIQKEDIQKKEILRTQQQLAEEACSLIADAHLKNYSQIPAVVCAHLFAASGNSSEEERIDAGTLEQVDSSIFSPFTYTALGHLHGCHPCSKTGNVRYSGSPLAYSFDDKPDTYMLSVIVEKKDGRNSFSVATVPVHPLHSVAKLTGEFNQFAGNSADKNIIEKYKNSYVQIVCTDSLPHENPMTLLRINFPHILSFTRIQMQTGNKSSSLEERRKIMESSGEHKPEELFTLFIKDTNGGTLPCSVDFDAEKKLFSELSKNYTWTEN